LIDVAIPIERNVILGLKDGDSTSNILAPKIPYMSIFSSSKVMALRFQFVRIVIKLKGF